MTIFENIWWLLVLIGVMILIHELGHYWAARLFDVRVETFSFGFGPRLFGFRRGETDFRFSAILFGGYVKMAGEQPGDDAVSDPRSFLAKPRWQRLIIAFAGPLMNIVLAVVLLTGLFMVRYPRLPNADGPATVGHVAIESPAAQAGIREGDRIIQIENVRDPKWDDILVREIAGARKHLPVIVERNGEQIRTTVTPVLDEKTGIGYAGWAEPIEIQVADIVEGMDAARAGLQTGDVLISINNQPVRTIYKLHEVIRASEGQPVELVYARNGVRDKVTVTPSFNQEEERWMIGVKLEPKVEITRLGLGGALAESVRHNIRSATLIFQSLSGIIERRMSAKSLSGPVGIAQISGEAARTGATAFIGLMAMVSLNLAIFNLLPIPILDGGVILLLLVEMIMRRDLSMAVKEAVFKVGFVFLMAIVAFVLYNDISKLLPPG
ncbi:MAG: RIP metalloprotease RseP [Bryobacteraceae bacterium]